MPRKKPLVVVTRKLPDTTETRLMELFDVKLNVSDEPMDASRLAEAMATADVLVPTITDRIDADLLQQHHVAGEEPGQVVVAHGVTAELDDEGLARIAPHVRQGLRQGPGLGQHLVWRYVLFLAHGAGSLSHLRKCF